jgi:hypothetical protein
MMMMMMMMVLMVMTVRISRESHPPRPLFVVWGAGAGASMIALRMIT